MFGKMHLIFLINDPAVINILTTTMEVCRSSLRVL